MMSQDQDRESRGTGPGLRVALRVTSTGHDRRDDWIAVRIDVAPPARLLRMSVYLDGHLMDTLAPASSCEELRLHEVRGRHVITARVVDASGRWGGASTLVDVGAA
jgi:hypothetical protein